MNKKIIIKIIYIFCITIILISSFCLAVDTINPDNFDPDGYSEKPSSSNPTGKKFSDGKSDSKLATWGNKMIGLVQGVGSVASVVALVLIGIKYMIGSVEEKAEYKKTMIPYVIGCILIFAASNIVAAIYGVF